MKSFAIVPNEDLLLQILMDGGMHKGNALAKALDVSPITIRQIVNHHRCLGVPICSSSRGYYISHDPMEIQKTISSCEHRIMQMQKAICGLKVTLNEIVPPSGGRPETD